MAIYAWPGVKVEMVTACMAPLWIEQQASAMRRHYSEPKQTRRTKKIEGTVSWFAKLKAADDGRMLYNGKWADVFTLKADDGWEEINRTFLALLPEGEAEKFEAWRKADGPIATELFPLLPTKEVAHP